MDIIGIISLVSGVITIPSIFIPQNWRSKKLFFISFIFLVTLLSGLAVNQSNKLKRIAKVSRASNELVKRKGMEFTDEGFIQAGLAFMEQNKDLLPESYERAKQMKLKLEKSVFSATEVSTANEMAGLLKGIAILSDSE